MALDYKLIAGAMLIFIVAFGWGYLTGMDKGIDICFYGAERVANITIEEGFIKEINYRFGKEIIKFGSVD